MFFSDANERSGNDMQQGFPVKHHRAAFVSGAHFLLDDMTPVLHMMFYNWPVYILWRVRVGQNWGSGHCEWQSMQLSPHTEYIVIMWWVMADDNQIFPVDDSVLIEMSHCVGSSALPAHVCKCHSSVNWNGETVCEEVGIQSDRSVDRPQSRTKVLTLHTCTPPPECSLEPVVDLTERQAFVFADSLSAKTTLHALSGRSNDWLRWQRGFGRCSLQSHHV